jgi:microcystin degradation protein MlrC
MRLLIAMMKHETNTFSPVPTPLARFGNGPGPLYGGAAVRAYRGTGTGLGAYLDLAEQEDAEIVLPIAAGAPPSGPVDDAAYAEITDCICAAASKGGFDGIMLDLHGAMVTQSLEDGEGEFLKRLRTIAPTTPIAVSLDMHANLYDEIIANATVVTGYRTYPHIDTYETARLAGEILLRTIRGELRPVMAWGNAPMLPHVMRQGTDDHPNKELQHRCAAMSAEGALAASLFTGFPHADITNAGLSAVVVTNDDRELAERLRDELLDRAWVEREAFVY